MKKFLQIVFIIMTLIVFPVVAQELPLEDPDTQETLETPENTAPEETAPPVVEDETLPQDENVLPDQSVEETQPAKTKSPKKVTKKAAAKTGSQAAMSAAATTGEETAENSAFSAPSAPDVSIYTGSAGYKVPIRVPAGRNGLGPQIALTYNSYRGNSWVGLGWDLDLGAIRRSTKRGLNYSANDFVFASAGSSEELLPRSGWGPNYYGAKIEEGFAKYYFNTTFNRWEVTAKDGTRYWYGSTAASRQDDVSGVTVYQWGLDRVEDTNGNYLTVTYFKDQGEIYPAEIKYTGHTAPALEPANSVQFILEDRTDIGVSYATDYKVVTAKRLQAAAVYANTQLVRKYVINRSYSPTTKRSLIDSITQYGSDGISSLPVTGFQYQNGGTPGTFDDPIIQDASSLLSDMLDINGDGLGDLISYSVTNPKTGNNKVTLRYRLSLGNGTFAAAVDKEINLGDLFAYKETQECGYVDCGDDGSCYKCLDTGILDPAYVVKIFIADINGDGKVDIITGGKKNTTTDRIAVCLGSGVGQFGAPIIQDGVAVPNNIVDLNGDGLNDVISYTAKPANGTDKIPYSFRLSLGNGQFGSKVSKEINLGDIFAYKEETECGWVDCGDHSCYRCTSTGNIVPDYALKTFISDINGDGKVDIIFFGKKDSSTSRIAVCLGKGVGDFDTRVIQNGISFPDNIIDLNGDGLPDCVSVSATSLWDPRFIIDYRLSQGNGTFGSKVSITTDLGSLFSGNKPISTCLTDFNGDGKADVMLFGTRSDNQTKRRALFVASGSAPDLLSGVTNSLGGSAALTYKPSFQCADTTLPFLMQTLNTLTTNDGLGNLSATTYTYTGGAYDPVEREFRGFATATRTNPDGTMETSLFHQDKFFQGRAYQTEFRNPAGTLLSKSILTWDKTWLDSPTNTIAFVKLLQKRSESYDDQTVFSQEDNTYDDSNGNLLTTLTQGTDAENLTKTNLYQNYGSWTWRQTQETLTGSVSGKVRESYYTYENNTANLSTKSSWLQGGTNPVITMTYDDYGNVLTVTDARGNSATTQYDTSTNTYPIRVTAPPTGSVTHITETGWNSLFGRPIWTKDENTNQTNYQYDVFGRLIQIDYPDGGQTTYRYFTNVFPRYVLTKVKENTAGGMIDKYEYVDGFGRSIQTASLGEGNKAIITKTHYDNMGRAYLSEGPFFATGLPYPQQPPVAYPWTRITYDKRGRPILVEKPHGDYAQPVTMSFAYYGLSATVTDPDNSRKTEKKDYLGRITEVVEYENTNEYHTTYAYNAAGDLVTVTNAYANQTNLVYDTLGRKKEMIDPDMGHWTYTYDPNGNLLTQTDAKNQVITFTYDALNRVLTKSNGTTYAYDNLTANANGRGRVYSVTKGTTVNTNNSYDKMGRVLSATRTIDGNNYTTQNVYDLSGKVSQVTYPDGHPVVTTYYPGTGLVQTVSNGTTNYGIFTDYEPTGKIGQVTHQNGIGTIYTYDPYSTKLSGIVTEVPEGNPADALQDKSYRYTRAGDIYQIIDNKKNVTYTYTYDSLHRLKTENGGPEAIGYTYNAVGSILTRTIGTKTFTYSYNNNAHVHAVSSIAYNSNNYAFNYDANGNLTSGPDLSNIDQVVTRTVAYDADNMPTQIVRAGTTVNFTYDGIGTRIKKAVAGGSTTLYIGVHYEVKDNNVTKYIFGGNLRLAVLKGSLTYYYHKDHLGSTGAITDDTGAKVESAEYHPFGTTREHTGSNVSDYKFTDQELDNETNLYNYDARLYDPVLGMFVTPDNIVPNMFDPQSFNRYSYCRNNPLIYVDPSGHGEVIGGGVPSNGNSDDPDYKGKINETGNKDKVSTPKKTSKSKTKPSVKQKPQQTEEETTGFPLSFDSFIKQAKKVINSMNLTMMTSGEEDQKRQKIAEAIVKGAEVLDKLAPVIEKPTKIDRLKEHLTDDDLDAARRELVGEVVATKSDGTPYDHVTEVREAQTGLVNEIGRINKELSKPDLTQEQRENLTDLLSQASRMLDYTKGFVP